MAFLLFSSFFSTSAATSSPISGLSDASSLTLAADSKATTLVGANDTVSVGSPPDTTVPALSLPETPPLILVASATERGKPTPTAASPMLTTPTSPHCRSGGSDSGNGCKSDSRSNSGGDSTTGNSCDSTTSSSSGGSTSNSDGVRSSCNSDECNSSRSSPGGRRSAALRANSGSPRASFAPRPPLLVTSSSQDGKLSKDLTASQRTRDGGSKPREELDTRKDMSRSQVTFLPSFQLDESKAKVSNSSNDTLAPLPASEVHLRPSHRDFALPTPDITDLFNLLRAHPRAHQEGLSFTVSKRFCVFHPFCTSQSHAVTQVVVQRVIASAASPLLLSLNFKGDTDRVLFKCGADLRLDMAVMQTFRVMNELWAQNELMFEGVSVHARTYGIAALSPDMGLVEFVEGCDQLKNIAGASFTPGALTNMVASAAGAYVAAYVLKIRDRHFDNILVHRDGWLFHIDFSHILGASVSLDTSEFAVTAELYCVLGPTRWPAFVETCVRAFAILRQNFEVLKRLALTLFSPFDGLQLKLDSVLRDSLMIRLQETEAIELLKVTIEKAPFNLKTKIKNVIHELVTTLDGGL